MELISSLARFTLGAGAAAALLAGCSSGGSTSPFAPSGAMYQNTAPSALNALPTGKADRIAMRFVDVIDARANTLNVFAGRANDKPGGPIGGEYLTDSPSDRHAGIACTSYWCVGDPPQNMGNRSIFIVLGQFYQHTPYRYELLRGAQWCKLDGSALLISKLESRADKYWTIAPGEILELTHGSQVLWTIKNPNQDQDFTPTSLPSAKLDACLPLSPQSNPWTMSLVRIGHHRAKTLGNGEIAGAHGTQFGLRVPMGAYVNEICWADGQEAVLQSPFGGLLVPPRSVVGVALDGAKNFFVSSHLNPDGHKQLELDAAAPQPACYSTGTRVAYSVAHERTGSNNLDYHRFGTLW